MKKITTIAAMLGLGCLGAFEMPKVDVNTSVGFDTEYVYRGVKRAQQTFLPKAEMSLAVFEGAKLYFGATAALPLKDIDSSAMHVSYSWNRTDLYIGMTYKINDMFTVDAGYDHYFYTNVKSINESGALLKYNSTFVKTDMNEVYVGVIADVIASPSIYASYDFNCRELAVEGKVGYTLDLGQFGLNNFAADFSGKAGFDTASRAFGVITGKNETGYTKQNLNKKYYFYYGVGADLVYSLTDSAKIRAGVAYEGNSAKKDSVLNIISCFDADKGHKNMIFFRSSVDCAF
ncbi:MAG: hypothetical protein EOM76_11545 [Sphingobacteriia bacterium]|nr:hypothetical protein [Sphingobacteriia bacterium]